MNSTNLQERRAECINEVRDYFADLDGAPPDNINRLELVPHLIAETSPGRITRSTTSKMPRGMRNISGGTQLALAEPFDSDRTVCDLARVMRFRGSRTKRTQRLPSSRASYMTTATSAISTAPAVSTTRS